jgi:hypothetical protein
MSDTVKQSCRFFCRRMTRLQTEQSRLLQHDFMLSKKTNAVTDSPLPGALKLKEARQYLGGLSVPTMHRLIKRGLLKPCRATRHLLFPLIELDRFLRQ